MTRSDLVDLLTDLSSSSVPTTVREAISRLLSCLEKDTTPDSTDLAVVLFHLLEWRKWKTTGVRSDSKKKKPKVKSKSERRVEEVRQGQRPSVSSVFARQIRDEDQRFEEEREAPSVGDILRRGLGIFGRVASDENGRRRPRRRGEEV